jgi:hypothetical protein
MGENIAENELDRQVLEDRLMSNQSGAPAAPARTGDLAHF